VRRCPYLEQILRDRRGLVSVYRFDCHVDRRSHTKLSLRGTPPICVREYEECALYRSERQREDGIISRYTD
jgi:hypothetical protein